MAIPKEIESKILEVLKNIRLHCAVDYEVTIDGNGYNPVEALGGVIAVMQALGIRKPAGPTPEEIEEFESKYFGY